MKKILLTMLSVALATGAAKAQTTQLGTAEYQGYSKYIKAVDEYVPAPGQYTNTLPAYEEGDNATTMAQKCTDKIANNKGSMVSLGAYGGYITFHFDHSIANVSGQKDFYVKGNAFSGSAEPGIVMVSKDVNGNGLPDDPWYELSGSADVDSVGKVIYNYEITYTKNAMNNVPWTDNQGKSGSVARNGFHKQEYFPLWLGDSITFKGTLLPRNGYNKSATGQNWVLNSFAYGYVDNLPNSNIDGNSFDISWAVDADRNPVTLDAIDFVRVYCAENQMAGWLGETSTEVAGAEDLHLEASVDAQQAAGMATFEDVTVDDNLGYYIFKPAEYDAYVAYEGHIVSGDYKFSASYTDYGMDTWSGFAVANMTGNTFATYTTDQYKNAKGGGYNSSNYAVAYAYGTCKAEVASGKAKTISGFYLNNDAWAVDAFVNGDGMTTGAFTTGDWMKLTLTGTKADSTTTTKDIYLADYRSADAADHYYIADWTWVDLTDMGELLSVDFALSSSRNNAWGMTTPAYFCIDDFGGVKADTPTAIVRPDADGNAAASVKALYGIDGRLRGNAQRGINIMRMSNGAVKKVVVK